MYYSYLCSAPVVLYRLAQNSSALCNVPYCVVSYGYGQLLYSLPSLLYLKAKSGSLVRRWTVRRLYTGAFKLYADAR